MKNLLIPSIFLLANFLVACKKSVPEAFAYETPKNVLADSAAVVSPHPLATAIGLEVLKSGGNAIDAMVAVQFAIAVVYPRAGNIGGGGFMVIRKADGTVASIDYREKAPLGASRDMYLDSLGNIVEGLSLAGHLAAGVPGSVAGLYEAWQKHGQLKSFETIIQPAIDLAENGFRLSTEEAERLNDYQEAFRQHNDSPNPFIRDTFLAGDLFVQKELAETLKRIQTQGPAGFYEGQTADYIVAEMKSASGLITHEDLRQYKAVWRDPIVGNYKDYRIISMGPPSSGGIALLQMLEMVEKYPLAEWGLHTPSSIHLMAEAERRAFSDRAKYLGDADFYEVPIGQLLDSSYLAERMASYDAQLAGKSDLMGAGHFEVGIESFETTHTSVIDAAGNAVSTTTTLNSNYGCKVWVDGAGFLLNNEMDDFSSKPGVPNQFGLVGAEANAIQPGKRMLSSMTPTIVEKDGHVFMVLGAPGGSTIITAVFQVFLNVAEFGLDLQQAVDAPRFHHQWLPDEIWMESGYFPENTRNALTAKGHQLKDVGRMAVIKAIHVRPDGQLQAVGDFRNPDDTAGGD
ncbi:MAG TPA: gamma-glutamyltransferase [Saprospiraceae bacterium]|nr:gamma-glutamyltransferase [Saprospiraceae bacterium]